MTKGEAVRLHAFYVAQAFAPGAEIVPSKDPAL